MKLDTFKQRTLDQLARKQEGHNNYPIHAHDLVKVDQCNLCGSGSISLLAEVYLETNLNFCATSVCRDCLYTFRSVSPSMSWFKKCWKTISTNKLEVFNPEVEDIRQRRYEKYYALLSRYVPTGRLLDVGAAYGTGTKVFQDRGFAVEALEPEDDKANYIQNIFQIPVFPVSIEEFISRQRVYDIVIFAHCLEHLDNPQAVMANMQKLVNQERGILYVEVPVLWNFVTWSDALYLTHKSNFTEENLFDLLTKSGFEILETVWQQHTPDEPWDLGVVARPIAGQAYHQMDVETRYKHTVEDVQKLYRKDLPLTNIPPTNQVLRYRVPYIEQFYCTLRFNTKKIVEPSADSDFISFKPT